MNNIYNHLNKNSKKLLHEAKYSPFFTAECNSLIKKKKKKYLKKKST